MTPDEALALVASRSAGRTRYEGQEPRVDEVLAAEVRRLRGVVATLCDDVAENLKSEYPYRHQYPSQMRHYMAGLDEINEYLRSVGAKPKCQKP